jgi:hypothetical protein
LSKKVLPREVIGVGRRHFLVKYTWLGKQEEASEKEKLRHRFYREVKKLLPGNLTPYTSTKSSIEVEEYDTALAIFKLAVGCGADLVTLDGCTTLKRHNASEENEAGVS